MNKQQYDSELHKLIMKLMTNKINREDYLKHVNELKDSYENSQAKQETVKR